MPIWLIIIILAVLGVIIGIVGDSRRDKNDVYDNTANQQEAEKRLESVIGEGEVIEVMCPADHGCKKYYAVTDKKLYIEDDPIKIVPLDMIKEIKLISAVGGKTDSVADSTLAKICTTDKRRINLTRYAGKYDELVLFLYRKKPY